MKNPSQSWVLPLVLLNLTVPSALATPAFPPDLPGEYTIGMLSFSHYRDATTGQLTDDGGGIGDKIKIGKDGRYERAARFKLTVSSCTTRIALWEKGTVQVKGKNITFRLQQSTLKSEDTCNSQFNYTKSASDWTSEWSLGRDSYNRVMLYLKSEKGQTTSYVRQLSSGF